MTTINLSHIKHTQLDDQAWCATAQILIDQITINQIIIDQPSHKRQQQRSGVRQLLQSLLHTLGINDVLDEAQFPYRLKHSRDYVCFSHSGNHVAVALSKHRAIGIDIEVQDVSWQVAKRFYDDHELTALQSLRSERRTYLCRVLWQIKESFIKIHQYKLAQGLGEDYSHLIADLIDSADTQSAVAFIKNEQSKYTIAVLSSQQTVVIF